MRYLVSLLALVSFASAAPAQSPRGKAELTLGGARMTVDYGRPSLEGRDMLARAPVGFVWRLGADQATTLEVDGIAVFGNMVVNKGKYSLFAERTSEDRWTLVVNSETGQWGTEHDRKKDLIGVPLKRDKQEESTEQLTIELLGEGPDTGLVKIRWGREVLMQRFRLVPSK